MKDKKEPQLRISRRDAEHMLHELVELVAALQRIETRLRLALRDPKDAAPENDHD